VVAVKGIYQGGDTVKLAPFSVQFKEMNDYREERYGHIN